MPPDDPVTTCDSPPSSTSALVAAAAVAILCPLVLRAAAASFGWWYLPTARGVDNRDGAATRSPLPAPSGHRGDDESPASSEETASASAASSSPLSPLSVRRRRPTVPFFYRPPSDAMDSDPPFAHLLRSLDQYHADTSSFLAAMTRSEEVARRSEWVLWGEEGDDADHPLLAARLRDKIGWIAEVMERDGNVLEGLLRPFEVAIALPPPPLESESEALSDEDRSCEPSDRSGIDGGSGRAATAVAEEARYSLPRRPKPSRKDGNDIDPNSSYDSAAQIVTHIVRDWTASGSAIRNALYGWCVDQLHQYGATCATDGTHRQHPVLVPGAGLGRLAFDIAKSGLVVEANDVSVSMAAAAYRFLNGDVEEVGGGIIHPFSFDFLVNEVDSARRYDAVKFPDVDLSVDENGRGGSSLSYTLGDFVETYASSSQRGRYGAVVTCFFLDTATNVFEYLAVIRSAVRPGGLWINVGPLQWHRNALVHPSADELRELVEAFGFDVVHWSVDREPVNYRHDGDSDARYTKVEAYLPLRFVAVRKARGAGKEDKTLRDDADRSIGEMRASLSPANGFTAYAEKKTLGSEIAASETELTDEPARSKEGERGNDFVFVQADYESSVIIEEL